ncbi:MAG: hypothetical protein A3G34_09155 [Candidatus Lindowbacteria bacterium RIFCSPLOWO2_12_FULL_62_27]|nr:MAG: hypothetical protein A3G34_09155 [Candidatus Lindowbacteria bacterium RIFCSPLOWO2_12_FULL_62_27]
MKARRLTMRVSLVAAVVAVLAAAQSADATSSKAGTRAFQFLKLGLGSRAVGMGGAFTARADDVSALYWNPAGLQELKRAEILVSHLKFIEDINYSGFAYAHPLPRRFGTLGTYVTALTMGDIDKTIAVKGAPFFQKVGTFTASDYLFGLGYANRFGLWGMPMRYGFTLKFFKEKIDVESATGLAVDFGLKWKSPDFPIDIAFTAANIGRASPFDFVRERLPERFTFGVNFRPFLGRLNVATDLVFPTDNQPYFNLGVEGWVVHFLAFRAGYTARPDNTSDEKGYSVGMGIRIVRLVVDYAFKPYDTFGSAHQFSLLFKF